MMVTVQAEVSLAWFLALTKSCLLCSWFVYALETTRQRSHANDIVNAKSHAREKSPLTGHVMVELETAILITYMYLH